MEEKRTNWLDSKRHHCKTIDEEKTFTKKTSMLSYHIYFSFPIYMSHFLTHCRRGHPAFQQKWILCRWYRLRYTWNSCFFCCPSYSVFNQQDGNPLPVPKWSLLLIVYAKLHLMVFWFWQGGHSPIRPSKTIVSFKQAFFSHPSG